MENQPASRLERLLPVFIFFAAFGFCLVGLNPSFYADDSPETITACATFGIPHPPGYPLHTMIGSFFATLPLATIPFRVNLLSAFLAASVCAALFFLLKEGLTISTALATVFSLFWIVGATTYPEALSAKTGLYQLTALFLAVILLALLKGRDDLAAFLFGLSLTHHWMSMTAFAPGLLYLWISLRNNKEWGRKETLRSLAFLGLGFSVLLLLPLRAMKNPLLNWGNPSTLENFVFNFIRRQYQGAEATGGPSLWFQQWWVYLKTAFWEFPGLLLLAVFGGFAAYRVHRPTVRGLLVIWFLFIAVVGVYLALSQERLYLITAYVMPTHLFLLLFSAWGISLVFFDQPSDWMKKFGIGKWIIVAVGMILIGLSVVRFQIVRQTDYTYDYDYVLNGFRDTPRSALYFCKGDSIVFPCWYFQWVEKKRTDLAIIGVDGLPMEWIRKNLAQLHPGLKVPFTPKSVGNEAIIPMTQWLVDKNPDRELYFSYNKVEDGTLPGIKLVPYGLVTKGFLKGKEPSLEEARSDYFWKVMRLRNMGDPKLPIDSHTQELMVRDYGVFRNSLGVYYEDLGDDLKAKPTAKSTATDLLNTQHYYEKSRESFEWAQRWDPLDLQYAYNLGNALFHVGHVGDSMVWYEKATQLNPQYSIAYFNWAVAAMGLAQYQKAGDLFKKALGLKPDYTQAQQGLDYVTKQGLYKPQ